MGIRVTFACDHEGCDQFYLLDSKATEHLCDDCGGETGRNNVPADLRPVIAYLTDDQANGGAEWEVCLQVHRTPGRPDLMLVRHCFCPKHGDDVKTMPEYQPDARAKRHARWHRSVAS
jgi:hypothetical protein